MITLAFDTCLDKMYVVLKKNGEVLNSCKVENHDNKYHSAFLISTLQEVMAKNGISPQDVDLIATNIGPGSFTGIRACVTVARVMAQQLNCKAVGVSSLEVLAKCAGKNPLVALDARKNSAYLYVNEEIQGAIQLEKVKEMLENRDYNLITDDKLQKVLGGTSYQAGEHNLGEILANLTYEKLKTSSCKWQELKPLYIQPPPMG